MNRTSNRPTIIRTTRAEDLACLSKACLCLLFLLLALAGRGQTKSPPMSAVFNHGEQVNYDLFFKWGILMPKAGMATLSMKESVYNGNPAWNYRLLFRTVGIMEKVFAMRDTIDCHFSDKSQLLFSSKRSDEGDYYLIDNLKFSYDATHVTAASHRYTPQETKVDTVLKAEGYMFDMLGATMYLRSIEWNTISNGDSFPFYIAIGRDIIKANFRYTGQAIVERGDVKYRTRHFYIDIIDEAFTQTKAAAEVWIGDDANHIPVKIRAKLKIGAAEVYYNSSSNLRYPLSCRVVLNRH